MTVAGEFKRFPVAPDGFAERITSGPDGALWFTDPKSNRIGRITVEGAVKYVKLPTPDCGPTGIATGHDGFIYFAEHAADRIGRLRPDGVLTEFTLPKGSGPAEVVAGYHAVYFAEDKSNRIGRISKDGAITDFAIPSPHSIPAAMTVGPDGSIYFTELHPSQIGKMTLNGAMSEYKIPAGQPLGLAAGSDGNIWATAPRVHLIYRMTSGGNFVVYQGTNSTLPGFLTNGPDGNLYFSEPNGKIGRISVDGLIAEFDVREKK